MGIFSKTKESEATSLKIAYVAVAKDVVAVVRIKVSKVIDGVVGLNGIEGILDQALVVSTAKLLRETHISRKVPLVGGTIVLVVQKRMEEAAVASVGIKNASAQHEVGLLACFEVDVARGPEHATGNVQAGWDYLKIFGAQQFSTANGAKPSCGRNQWISL